MNEINSNNKQVDDTTRHHNSTNVCSQLISQDNDNDVNTSSTSSSKNTQHTKSNISLSSYILTSSKIHESNALNLKEILQLFNCAISQEQAWAVLYQTLNGLKYLFKNNLELIKSNVDNIVINLLFLNKDGSVLFCFNTNETDIVSLSSDVPLGELLNVTL